MTFALHEASLMRNETSNFSPFLMGSSRLQRRTGLAREDSQFPDGVSTGKVKKSYKMMLQLVVVVVFTLLAFWVQYKITEKVALLHVQQSLVAQNEKPNFVSGANEESKDTDSQFGVAESDVKKKEDGVSNALTDENEQTQESNAEKENHETKDTDSQFGVSESDVKKKEDSVSNVLIDENEQTQESNAEIENHETKDTDSQFGVSESDVKKKEDSVSNVLIDENEQTQESNAEIENHVDENTRSGDGEPAVEKVKDVISSMFAKGIILGKDAVKKAKKSNQLMNEKARGLDEKLHVSEKLLSGASLVTGALNGVAKAATDIGEKTKDKVLAAEEQQSKLEGRAGTHGTEDTRSHDAEFSVEKVKDVFGRVVSKGFVLGEDALKKAKWFIQNNQFTSTTAAKVASAYKKIGASKIVINDKMRGIGQMFHVSEKISTGATLVTGALKGIPRRAAEIGQKTKEK